MNREELLEKLDDLKIPVTARYFKPSPTELKVFEKLLAKIKSQNKPASATRVKLVKVHPNNELV